MREGWAIRTHSHWLELVGGNSRVMVVIVKSDVLEISDVG